MLSVAQRGSTPDLFNGRLPPGRPPSRNIGAQATTLSLEAQGSAARGEGLVSLHDALRAAAGGIRTTALPVAVKAGADAAGPGE